MSFLTESQIQNFQRSTKSFTLSLNESLRNYSGESSFLRTKIFLSHKHSEKDKLEGAIAFLKSFGVDIYVDWLDEEMPKRTSGVTAEKIKKRITENHKFILLATEEAISSKWCNWELGLGDAAKYIENIAIMPIAKDYKDFSGSEYLEIYPYIFSLDSFQYFKGSYRDKGVYVVFPNEKVIPINEWLRR